MLNHFWVVAFVSKFDKMSLKVGLVFFASFVIFIEGLDLEVGSFKTRDHGVNGTVYITGEFTIAIRGFSYDGK